MEHDEFDEQLVRLRTQWPHSYGDERVAILWRAFQRVSITDFADAVTECLASHRSAPLAKEVDKEIQEVQRRNAQDRIYRGLGAARPMDPLVSAALENKTADPEFVKACMKLLRDKQNGVITHEQFLQGCDYLDQVAGVMKYKAPKGREAAAGKDG